MSITGSLSQSISFHIANLMLGIILLKIKHLISNTVDFSMIKEKKTPIVPPLQFFNQLGIFLCLMINYFVQ